MVKRSSLFTVLAAVLLFAPSASAAPVTFTVNSNSNAADDNVGSGGCHTAANQCTLRAAIQEANANANAPDSDTIDFAPAVSGQILIGGSALPQITDDVTIDGPGAGQLAVDGADSFRVFDLSNGDTASISDLTVRNGRAPVSSGFAFGGGIANGGDLTLDRVAVTGNTARVDAPINAAVEADGGGIETEGGTLTLRRSTVSGNDATVTGSGTADIFAFGGGIRLAAGGELNVDRTTISDNDVTATISAGVQDSFTHAEGGGIYDDGALSIDRSTLSGNAATASGGTAALFDLNLASGGGVHQNSGTFTATGATLSGNSVSSSDFGNGANLTLLVGGTLRSTIVANPTGAANCSGSMTSSGFNLEDDPGPSPSCSFTQATDIAGQNPLLDPAGLADNGGPTRTIALQAGSPAIDKGNSFSATTDQRDTGFPRISDSPIIPNASGGDGADIGAFERDVVGPETTIDSGPPSPTGDPTPTFAFHSSEGDSTLECRVDGGSFSTCTSPKTTAALSDGSHIFRVRAKDPNGNADLTPASRTFTVDTTAPDTSIISGPAQGSTTNDPTPTFGFSSSESGASFRCKVDGGPFAACTSPRTVAALDEGSHTFAVRATDSIGHTDATPASRSFTVDTTAPDTEITKGPKKKVKTKKKRKKVSFEFSSEAGTSFECSLDDEPFEPCTSPDKEKVKKGKHSFAVRAKDAAGNVDQTPGEQTFKVKRKGN